MPKTNNKREEILEFIRSSTQYNGYPPSVREIGKAVGLKSPSSVHGYLSTLAQDGLIKKDSFKTRALVLNDGEHISTKNVPIVGDITAGEPILAVQNIEEFFPVPEGFFSKESAFILKVKGESMIEAGIFNGDYVVVKQQNYAYNGDIVVALLDDSATVKRFFKEESRIRLQPENSTMKPIYARDVKIQGVVIGLIRKYNN